MFAVLAVLLPAGTVQATSLRPYYVRCPDISTSNNRAGVQFKTVNGEPALFFEVKDRVHAMAIVENIPSTERFQSLVLEVQAIPSAGEVATSVHMTYVPQGSSTRHGRSKDYKLSAGKHTIRITPENSDIPLNAHLTSLSIVVDGDFSRSHQLYVFKVSLDGNPVTFDLKAPARSCQSHNVRRDGPITRSELLRRQRLQAPQPAK